MKYCAHCGAELVAGAKFCVYCGNQVPVTEDKNEQQEPIFVNSTPVTNNEPKAEQKEAPKAAAPKSEPQSQVSGADAVPSMVFGILSVFMAFFSMYPILGFIFTGLAIAFICVAKSVRRRFVRDYGMDNGFSRAGSITSTVAIPLVSFFSFIGTLFSLVIIFGE